MNFDTRSKCQYGSRSTLSDKKWTNIGNLTGSYIYRGISFHVIKK